MNNNCPQCHQPIEATAAFCGNCGFALSGAMPQAGQPQSLLAPAPPPPGMQAAPIPGALNQPSTPGPMPGLGQPATAGYVAPAYGAPLAVGNRHVKDVEAILSMGLAVLSVPLTIMTKVVAIGLALGIAALVLGTLSRHAGKRIFSTLGLIFACIALMVNIAYLIKATNDNVQHQKAAQSADNASLKVQATISTPCYEVHFSQPLNTQNSAESCTMYAFDGPSMEQSNIAYKVIASSVTGLSEENFVAAAKPAIEKDLASALPSFHITTEGNTTFEGAPAYFVNVANGDGVAVNETAVFHATGAANLFVLLHAAAGDTATLGDLDSGWSWND